MCSISQLAVSAGPIFNHNGGPTSNLAREQNRMIRADYDPKYFRRFLLIGLGCIAFTIWCFYDALVAYPRELERSQAYWTPSPDRADAYIAMQREPWRTLVRERGWSTDPPEQPTVISHKITSQYFYAVICLAIAVPCLFKWFRARGSWVEGNREQLRTSWGPEFQYQQISRIDKTKWEKKGITRIHYKVNEDESMFAFDDFKFRREPMGEILFLIEATLKDSQISGGPRETDAKKAADDATPPDQVAAPASDHSD